MSKEVVEKPKKKRTRLSQQDVPSYSLEQALRVPVAIFDNYAGDPTPPLRVASALNLRPTNADFKMLCGAAIAYGLTEGGYNASEIKITDHGKKILKPLEEGADHNAKVEALLKPRVINEFLTKYDNKPIPRDDIAENVLEDMGVPRDRTVTILGFILESAEALGLITDIRGKKYVDLSASRPPANSAPVEEEEDEQDLDSSESPEVAAEVQEIIDQVTRTQKPESEEKLRRVFITHGKNKDFVDPIKKLLAFGELEAVVSVEKQSVSKPVPDKVMTDMRSCGAAIIHVEDEQRLIDSEAKETVVLNPNVLIEIGAAMALYGKRFILLVKEGVKLPSNLQGLFEVRYKEGGLDGDATIRLLEAINEMKKQQ